MRPLDFDTLQYEDLIDVEAITDRVEELEDEGYSMGPDEDDNKELTSLMSLLEEMNGNGGDHQWRGNWYPQLLVRDSYFADYTRELLEDVGYIPNDFPSWIEIDWEATARNCQHDYTPVDVAGVTYWYR